MTQSKPKYVVFDIEANGLLYDVDTVHCLVLRTYDGDVLTFYDGPSLGGAPKQGNLMAGFMALTDYYNKGYLLVGHNILGYDLPMLKKLKYLDPHMWVKGDQLVDTYIGVSLRYPEEKPGLEYWGDKFGVPKPKHEDWTVLSSEMVHRCQVDTAINELLLKALIREGYLEDEWDAARDLEQKVLWIHSQQVIHGMRVDIVQAHRTLQRMDGEIRRLTVMLHKDLPKSCVNQGELKSIFKKDGTFTHHVDNWIDQRDDAVTAYSAVHYRCGDKQFDTPGHIRIGGPFSRIDFEPVNLNSHPQVKKILLNLGWVPTSFNYKRDAKGQFERDEKNQLIPTTPKLTEDSYDSLPEGLGQNIAELLKLKHRRRFILNEKDTKKGLIGHVRADGRVACDAFTCGTNTGRYRHSGAFVNLPKVSTPWGPEIRSLFCVPGDRFLVGIDLDGIEARMMGHYASFYDGGAFAKVVLQGDVHQMTADAMGVDRETAKTLRYAISYGAGAGKVREILGCGPTRAHEALEEFWAATPGLAKLIGYLEQEYASKGYITGIDGRHLYIRHKHKLFNTLVQNAATVVFKKWMVRCYEVTTGKDIAAHQVLAYHDELGFEVYTPDEFVAIKYGKYMADQARIVGEDMNLQVPISAEAKVGTRYDEVH